MKYLPGLEKIIEESLEMFSLANTLFVSNESQRILAPHPYKEKFISENGHKLIIEKILSIAIKLRFLDDQYQLLEDHDRKNSGQVISNKNKLEIGLREAFNKIIHSQSIEIFSQPAKLTVSREYGEGSDSELLIPEGVYKSHSIFIEAKGSKGKNEWVFNSELLHLSNEIFRVISHFKSKPSCNTPN